MKATRFIAIAAVAVVAFACKEPSSYEKMVNEVKKDKELKALEASKATKDSISYLLGVTFGNIVMANDFFDGLHEINMEELKKGMADIFENGNPSNPYALDTVWAKKFKISPYDQNQIFNKYLFNRKAYKAKFNQKLGEKFLANNKGKSNVQVTESGLQYIIHAEGEGDLIAENDTLAVKYVGTFVDGTEFDRGDSLVFNMSKSMDYRTRTMKYPVIDGWAEGLRLMNKGAKATLYIPADLAYGESGYHGIEPNATLIFDVEVLEVRKYQEPLATEAVAE